MGERMKKPYDTRAVSLFSSDKGNLLAISIIINALQDSLLVAMQRESLGTRRFGKITHRLGYAGLRDELSSFWHSELARAYCDAAGLKIEPVDLWFEMLYNKRLHKAASQYMAKEGRQRACALNIITQARWYQCDSYKRQAEE